MTNTEDNRHSQFRGRHPTQPQGEPTRRRLFIEFAVIATIGYLLKVLLDQAIWRYSGPVSLVLMLALLFFYLRARGRGWSWIGLTPITSLKGWLLLLPQIVLAFFVIMVTALAIAFGGEALGIAFMKPDPSGASDRFGDLAGNTPLYLTWLAILWVAGPAEELYFRGFMIGQLQEVVGRSPLATILSILLPAIIFGAGHVYYLGLRGLFITGGIGLALGALLLAYKKNIWPLMIAHAAFNSLTFTAMYASWDI